VTVLEASDRVGGRTLSARAGGAAVDLGGQWLGSRQAAALALCRDFDLALAPQHARGRRVLELRGAVSTYSGLVPNASLAILVDAQLVLLLLDLVRLLLRALPAGALARWADATTVAALCARCMWTDGGRALVAIVVQGLFGCEPAELSLAAFARYVNASGSLEAMTESGPRTLQEWTVVGGAQQLTERLLARAAARGRARVELRAAAARVERGAAGGAPLVVTTAAGAAHDADFVVCALPPPRAAALAFSPPLDAARAGLLRAARMGGIIKAVATYDAAFWRAGGFSGEAIADTRGAGGPAFNVFDCCLPAEGAAADAPRAAGGPARGIRVVGEGARAVPGLVVFINGERAREWSARPAAERREAVLDQLARYFGARARAPLTYSEKDWVADDFTGGCPIASYGAAALTAFGLARALAEPAWGEAAPAGARVHRLHWAGTEAAAESTGFIDGAVRAGQAAAEAVAADARALAAPAGAAGAAPRRAPAEAREGAAASADAPEARLLLA